MANFNVEDILADLEAEAEKTAEEIFTSSLTDTAEAEAEKVASEDTTKETSATKEVLDKVATETISTDKIDAATEKIAETQPIPSNKEFVKMAQEFGKIAAHSLFTELAALGVAMPTNGEIAVPPISQVSRPSDSPVTVARDAAEQEAVGQAPYDLVNAHVPNGTGGYTKEKRASFTHEDVVQRIFNNIYSQEEN